MYTQSVKMDSTTLASFAYCNHIAVLLTQSVRLQSGQISLIRTEESVPAIFLFPQDKAHTHTHTHTQKKICFAKCFKHSAHG